MLSLVYVTSCYTRPCSSPTTPTAWLRTRSVLALQKALWKPASRTAWSIPNNPAELRTLAAEAVRNNAALQAVVESVNRYSLTVYDINIGDSQSMHAAQHQSRKTKTSRCRSVPTIANLLDANPIELMRQVFGPPRVFEVVVPLERNGEAFLDGACGCAHHAVARLLWAAGCRMRSTLMGFALGTALLVAFLLGNLALRPMEQISQQLDLLDGRQ